jgi:uncharacterized membrane protein YeiH
MRLGAGSLVLAADLAGIFVFAAEGALAAMRGNLDCSGSWFCRSPPRCVAASHAICSSVPPNAIRDWRYAAVAFTAGALAYLVHALDPSLPTTGLVTLDAVGLALFAVAGTEKALDFGISPFMAIQLGAITAVGGGVVRDVLLAQIPAVLRVDIYATAALAGSQDVRRAWPPTACQPLLAERPASWSACWPSGRIGSCRTPMDSRRSTKVWDHWWSPPKFARLFASPRCSEPRYRPPRPPLRIGLPQLGGSRLCLPCLGPCDIGRRQRVREIAFQPVDTRAGMGELGQRAVSKGLHHHPGLLGRFRPGPKCHDLAGMGGLDGGESGFKGGGVRDRNSLIISLINNIAVSPCEGDKSYYMTLIVTLTPPAMPTHQGDRRELGDPAGLGEFCERHPPRISLMRGTGVRVIVRLTHSDASLQVGLPWGAATHFGAKGLYGSLLPS